MPTVVAKEEVNTNASTTPSNIVVVVKDISIVISKKSVIIRSTDLAITGHNQQSISNTPSIYQHISQTV